MSRNSEAVIADVYALLRAKDTLLWVSSREEIRAERAVVEAASRAGYKTLYWDCATGLTQPDGAAVDNRLTDPVGMLARIRNSTSREVYILRDLHRWLGDPVLTRGLRSLARDLQTAQRSNARAVVVLCPTADVPPDLTGQTTLVDFPLPDKQEMAAVMDAVMESLPESLTDVADKTDREAAVEAAMGLTADEASSCYARSLVTKRAIDPTAVAADKRRVIAREQVLTWIDPDPRGLDAIGGLDNLKAWLTTRQAAFGAAAREYGLPYPRGVLLVGVPGCGKSLTAKAVASAWQRPLLRLDMGALRSKYVGESEGNIRRALSVAETVAPCVVWLDEIEKALAGGAPGAAADGGVAADALGTILSWMQDHTAPVFVVATANAVEALPSELLRKGRFDELFFVDLPNAEERELILATALRQHNQLVGTIDGPKVALQTEGFSGAEIAALVPEAMFEAFGEDQRAIDTDDVVQAAKQTVPLSATAADKLSQLREWAQGRTRPATKVRRKTSRGRQLDL
jgi:chloramphenicol 3-O-phosphotransferase